MTRYGRARPSGSNRAGWTSSAGRPRADRKRPSRTLCISAAPARRAARPQASARWSQYGAAVGRLAAACSSGPAQDHCAGREAVTVRDHAVPRDEADRSALHLPPAGLTAQLLDGFDDSDHAAAAARLAARQLPAAGVQRQGAIPGEPVRREERTDLALRTEAEILDLDRHHDRVIVI